MLTLIVNDFPTCEVRAGEIHTMDAFYTLHHLVTVLGASRSVLVVLAPFVPILAARRMRHGRLLGLPFSARTGGPI